MHFIQRAAVALAVLLPLGCSYIPFSGGELEGTLEPVPEDWGVLADASVIEIETRPSESYSVKLWAVAKGPVVYLHAGANRAEWVAHLEADPRVRMLVGESLYELNGSRVTTQEEFDLFTEVYEAKYGVRPRNENVEEAYLLRLERR